MISVRRSPVAGLVAFTATAVGLFLMIFGFVAPGSLGASSGTSDGDVISLVTNLVLVAIGLLIIVPTWVVFIRSTVSRWRERERVVGDVPHDVAEPPSTRDPALVSVLLGNGRPARRAVAGTVLDLARRRELSINEYGPRVVIEIHEPATAATGDEQLVLNALRSRAHDGNVEGPPIWPGRIRWWRAFERNACDRAAAQGLLAPRIPPISAMIVGILTATGLGIMFFDHTAVFIGSIIFANGFPQLLSRVSGYHLTVDGAREKAHWTAFGRYLHEQRSFHDVGPAAIVVWGPNLAYGAVLGEAPRASTLLTPGATSDDTDDSPAPPSLGAGREQSSGATATPEHDEAGVARPGETGRPVPSQGEGAGGAWLGSYSAGTRMIGHGIRWMTL